MKTFCVYCHISPSKKKYIGISCDPQKRWASGRGYIKNYHFYRAIKKYGWDSFEHAIIAEGLSAEEAAKMEADLIEKMNLTDPSFGYNLRGGGDGSFSEHSRALMSASRIGNKNNLGNHPGNETRTRISESLRQFYAAHPEAHKGRHPSPDTIAKLKARKISESTRQKMRENHCDVSGAKNPSARAVCQYTLSGEFVKRHEYAKAAANELGIDLSSIIKCCRHKTKKCGGYLWEYA